MSEYEFKAQQDTKVEAFQNMNQELIVSKNDAMFYRLIQLDNGLRAILVSDVSKIVDLTDLSEVAEESPEVAEGSSEEEEGDDDFICEGSSIKSDNDVSSEEDRESTGKGKKAEEKMAACALCIGVGSFSDPPDIPGLAHFLEHMVFMGSTKYPQENGFDEFIKKLGGSDNGSTDCETTTFHLECNEKYLREAMDRFAQFFISPLMKREAMTREREIIHSEFEMSLPSDGSRREQILGSLAPSGHPSGKFLWGNLTTLRDKIDDGILYERVHEFRRRHYSAHRMTLAVQGRLPLDTLEEYVRMSFGDVPNNGLPPDDFANFKGSYGDPAVFNKMVWIKPVKDICQVHLTWVLPPYMKEYKSKPLDYVGWLVGHEGKGSLLSMLRKKVWALECEAGNDESGFEFNSIYSLFCISLSLTEEGYQNLNEVIMLVFGYIAMLNETCPSKRIYDELHTVSETNFRYKTETPSVDYVEILAESMHQYEPKHYIVGGELYLEYKPEVIKEVLELLTPQRVNVIVYSMDKSDDFYDQLEPWFQTKYRIQEIPANWKEKWESCTPHEEFHIPEPNPYLTTDFSLLDNYEEHMTKYPKKIKETDLLEIWYRQDFKFNQPLAYYYFYMISPIIRPKLLNTVLLDVLSAYLETKFTEQIFTANQARLYCTYSPGDLGLVILLGGYNEKLGLLFDETLKQMEKFCSKEMLCEDNKGLFNAILKDRKRLYFNKSLKPKKLVKMARLSILVDTCWTSVDRLKLLNEVTLDKLYHFTQEFLHNVKILGLIQGNVSRETALELCEKFKTVLRCRAFVGEKPQIAVTKLKEGQELFLRLKSFNESDSNSVVSNYYQVGPTSIRGTCLIDLLVMLMDEPLFDSLRTKQQIGYDIHCLLRDTFDVLAFSITVFFQSHKFSPDEVDQRVEDFLKGFLKKMKSMSKKEWEETKKCLALFKNSADLELEEEVKRNFSEICSNSYIFDRMQRELETIPDISHKEFYCWFADHVASGKKFKKLSVQVVGGPQSNDNSNIDENKYDEKTLHLTTMVGDDEKKNFIKDIEDFKKFREFYPKKKKL